MRVAASSETSAHERLVAALKASRAGTWRWDIPTDRVQWDEALSQVYGLPHVESPRTSGAFLQLIHPDDRERCEKLLGALLASGSEIEYEFRAVIGDRLVWIYDRSTLMRDAEGRPAYMTGACLDVTERKRIEEERNAALAKHQLLLRELNHRVKNHLTMITAMLSLKAARQPEPAVRHEFEKAIQRIHTLAELHNRLYRDEGFEAIDMAAYLADVCGGLRGAVLTNRRVELDCVSATLQLSVDQAVPIGLIVSELATNAIKYAFPNGRAGKVTVRLDIDGADGHAMLSVIDDGVGLEATGNGEGGIGVGMVRGLAEQIGGTLYVTGDNGTFYKLRFKPDQRV
jgi:PAS domain S-box-containing protein